MRDFFVYFEHRSGTSSGRCGMKPYRIRESASEQPADPAAAESANDNFDPDDLQAFEATANEYERRWRSWTRLHKEFQPETIWLVICLYLILLSLAFVLL